MLSIKPFLNSDLDNVYKAIIGGFLQTSYTQKTDYIESSGVGASGVDLQNRINQFFLDHPEITQAYVSYSNLGLVWSAIIIYSISGKESFIIYANAFGVQSGTTPIPTGEVSDWTQSFTNWVIDGNTTNLGLFPVCTVPGTSGASMLAGTDAVATLVQDAFTASFSTIGLHTITVRWNGIRSVNAPVLSFAYSINGIDYIDVPFKDVPTEGVWHALQAFFLPAGAENKPNVKFRFRYTGTGTGNFIAIDDLVIQAITD